MNRLDSDTRKLVNWCNERILAAERGSEEFQHLIEERNKAIREAQREARQRAK